MPTTQVVPPPPIRQPIANDQGIMDAIWVNWFTQIWRRAGAGFAPTTQDLEILGAYAEIANGAVASEVSNLMSTVAANTAAIASNAAALVLVAARVSTLEVLTYYQSDVDLT